MRGQWYAQRVKKGKLTAADATREIETMRAVLQTLMRVAAGEAFRANGLRIPDTPPQALGQ